MDLGRVGPDDAGPEAEATRPGPGRGVAAPGKGPLRSQAHDIVPAGPETTQPPGEDLPGGMDPDLRRAVRTLRHHVAAVTLPLELPAVATARRDRELLLAQLDDYLLPRLSRMDAPLLAVIGGSTGAGKSTLTNSLARKVVSRSGVLRPTTRSPVLVHHPFDSGAFLTQRILPDLARITSEALEPLQPIELDAPRITALRLVPHEGLVPGLALLDAPDIDSVVVANRELAVQLLGAADLWLFVTTAARYGDALPWQMLQTAADRGVCVAVVLDRVPPESLAEVRNHLARMLRDRGLGTSPMFVIPEMVLQDGLLPENVVAPLRRWLMRLGQDSRSRDVVVRRTLTGIVDSLPKRIRALVGAAGEQEAAAYLLGTELDAVFATARYELTRRLTNGTVLRGEVLARWRELVGNGELVRHLERVAGRFTDRLVAAVRKPPPLPTESLGRALDAAVRAVVDAAVHDAVQQGLAHWQELPGGPGLVERNRSATPDAVLATGSGGTAGTPTGLRVIELVRAWQSGVLNAVEYLPAQSGMAGRTVALRPEGVAVLVMFVNFAELRPPPHSAFPGRPAGDPTPTPGTGELPVVEVVEGALLARRVLNTVFGEQAIQTLLDAAREDLRVRVEELLQSERSRLKAVLDEARIRPGSADALHTAVKVVENAR